MPSNSAFVRSDNYSHLTWSTSSVFNPTVRKVRDDQKQLQGCVLQNADEVYKWMSQFHGAVWLCRYWLLLFRIKTNLTFAGIPAKLCSYTLCGIHNTFIGGVEKCIQRSPRSGAVDYNFKGKCYACLNWTYKDPEQVFFILQHASVITSVL